MKILILSQASPKSNSGIVGKTMLDNLNRNNNVEAKLLVKDWDFFNDKNIIPVRTIVFQFFHWIKFVSSGVMRRLGIAKPTILKSTNPNYCVQDYDQTKNYFNSEKIIRKSGFIPDAIIVLFMSEFLSFNNLYELNNLTKAPIFLYMMDMAPFTGGCHYAWDCIGYTKECGSCIALYSDNPKDQTNVNFKFNESFVKKSNIIPVAASEGQYVQLCNSSLFKDKKKLKLLLPIDEKIYFPTDKITIRKKLGIPVDKKIIFFGAVYLDQKRKGFKELVDSLNILFKIISDPSKVHLIIAGNNNVNYQELIPFSFTVLGYLDHTILPKAFQAADVFVSASIEDSGPMMVNQSIMSGTPVVSFDIGIALDLIHNKETGFRVKLKDSNEMANGIKYILELDDSEYKKISANCRAMGINKFSINKINEELLLMINNQIV